jgi:hypothetical protein
MFFRFDPNSDLWRSSFTFSLVIRVFPYQRACEYRLVLFCLVYRYRHTYASLSYISCFLPLPFPPQVSCVKTEDGKGQWCDCALKAFFTGAWWNPVASICQFSLTLVSKDSCLMIVGIRGLWFSCKRSDILTAWGDVVRWFYLLVANLVLQG